jgi:quercetin dioxygenase-like cupin family protein
MRIISPIVAAVLSVTGPAAGQGLGAAPPVPGNVHFISAGEAIVKPLAEWDVAQTAAGEQTGARVLIAEGAEAVAKAPANASRYEARTYKFPSGTIRVLTFKKQPAGVIHQITYETEVFILQGSVTVDVRGKPVTLKAGDTVFLPGGVMRNKKPAGDTVIVQFFVNHTAKDAKGQAVFGKDVKESLVAQWMQDGKPMTARDAEAKAAPKEATRYTVKRYVFDGNSIRLANLNPGSLPPGTTQRADSLIYVTKGRLRRTEGTETRELVAGDALREEVGLTGSWEILEPSAFLATDAPRPMGVPHPGPSGR